MNPTNYSESLIKVAYQIIESLGGIPPMPLKPSNYDERLLQLLQLIPPLLAESVGTGGEGPTAMSAAWGAITGSLSNQSDLAAVLTSYQMAIDSKQPLDADLAAIADLATTAYGRGLLTLPDATALQASLGLAALAYLATVGTAQIENDAVTFAKLDNINTNTLLGRSTAGTGDVELITCTTAGRALIAGADAAAQRTTLGLGSVGCRVFHSINQSVANATFTPLAFNSERFDTDTIHDNATNNSRLTCKTAGTYIITGGFETSGDGGSYRDLSIRLNGSDFIAYNRMPLSSAGASTDATITTIYQLAVNSYVELVAYHNAGVSLSITAGPNYSPEFSMVRLV